MPQIITPDIGNHKDEAPKSYSCSSKSENDEHIFTHTSVYIQDPEVGKWSNMYFFLSSFKYPQHLPLDGQIQNVNMADVFPSMWVRIGMD